MTNVTQDPSARHASTTDRLSPDLSTQRNSSCLFDNISGYLDRQTIQQSSPGEAPQDMSGEQLTQRVVGGIPAARQGHLHSLPIMPGHPAAAAIHASVLRCGPAIVAVDEAGVAMGMRTIWVVPMLC